jgi:hypothetical protein
VFARCLAFLLFTVLVAACFHATPVTPAPATSEETEAIRGALRAHTWSSRRWREGTSAEWREDAAPTQFIFSESWVTIQSKNASGSGSASALCERCAYTLEGRNIKIISSLNGATMVFRVESHEPSHLQLFWYDLSRYFDLYPPGTAAWGVRPGERQSEKKQER